MIKTNDVIIKKFGYKKVDAKNFNKALIRLKLSKIIDGIGVFAVRDLKKGSVIGEAQLLSDDLFYTWDDFKNIDGESQEMIMNYCIGSVDGFYAPNDINYISIPWYINHHCNGNVGFNAEGSFITIDDVKKDQELFYDYGLAISNPNYKLICRCGAVNCRKTITGNDWKTPDYRRKNTKYMLPELKEYIKLMKS